MELGFDAVQFHDDDAVPELDDLSPMQIRQQRPRRAPPAGGSRPGRRVRGPAPVGTPHDHRRRVHVQRPKARAYAIERSKRAADIAQELGCDLMVLWLAREGTYLRESKDVGRAAHQLLEAINTLLAYDTALRIAIEPKPNEPMDLAYIPTMGHALALGFQVG